MIVSLYGAVEGKRYNNDMLVMSFLFPQLQLNARTSNGNPLCVYGDPVYLLRVQLGGPFKRSLN